MTASEVACDALIVLVVSKVAGSAIGTSFGAGFEEFDEPHSDNDRLCCRRCEVVVRVVLDRDIETRETSP